MNNSLKIPGQENRRIATPQRVAKVLSQSNKSRVSHTAPIIIENPSNHQLSLLNLVFYADIHQMADLQLAAENAYKAGEWLLERKIPAVHVSLVYGYGGTSGPGDIRRRVISNIANGPAPLTDFYQYIPVMEEVPRFAKDLMRTLGLLHLADQSGVPQTESFAIWWTDHGPCPGKCVAVRACYMLLLCLTRPMFAALLVSTLEQNKN